MTLLATQAELNGITTVDQAVAWTRIKTDVWNAVDEELEEAPMLQVLATLHKERNVQATTATTIPLNTVDTRDLSAVEISQGGIGVQGW